MASDTGSPSPTHYPPDIECFRTDYWDPHYFEVKNCSVTNDMVNFLNLTGDFLDHVLPYLLVYCRNPPDDDCPFGICPNPDIGGLPMRLSIYVTGFLLALLIMYSPERIKAAFWSQTLNTYSLLLTCGVSIIRKELTQFHSILLIAMACSPVNVYFAGYSIRAFWSTHRLETVLGRRQYARRVLVFLSVGIWIAIFVYVYLPQKYTRFAQDGCSKITPANWFFIASPFSFAWNMAHRGEVGLLVAYLAIPTLVIVAWIFVIIRKRKEIWPPGKRYKPRFGKVWRTVVTNYPFLQFFSIIVVPTTYWITCVEFASMEPVDDALSPLTFGQLLTLFTVVPPLVEAGYLIPGLWHWFINLRWVRFVTRRPAPQVSGQEEICASVAVFIDEKAEMADIEIDELPLLDKAGSKLDHSDESTECDTLLDDKSSYYDSYSPGTGTTY